MEEFFPKNRVEIIFTDNEAGDRYVKICLLDFNSNYYKEIWKLLKKILNVLNTNSFFVKNISFLAGDASDRKYFLAKTKKQEVIIMVDKNPDDLRQFLKITKALEKKFLFQKFIKLFKVMV